MSEANPLLVAGERRLADVRDRYLLPWQIALYEAILAAAVVGSAGFDLWLTTKLHQSQGMLATALRTVEDLGDSKWFIVPSACWLLACLLLFRLAGDPEVRRRLHWWSVSLAYLLASVSVSGIVANVFKTLFGRARPMALSPGETAEWTMFAFDWRLQSFPSGHATTLFSAAVALSVLFPRFRWFFIGAAVAGAFGRLAIGAHFFADIVAGAALGGFIAWWLKGFMARRGVAPVAASA